MTRVLGLITARGGSKSIPRKNLKTIAGKPLIAWSIEAAMRSQRLDRTVVSTDDEEIIEISRRFGAEVPFRRPPELAKDDSPHIDVVLHSLEWLRERDGYNPDYVMLLQPTSPLRTADDIDGAVAIAERTDADAVVSVVETHHHPYIIMQIGKNGTLSAFITQGIPAYARRQDIPKVYFVNGALWLNRCSVITRERRFYPEKTYPYFMPDERSYQIDTLWDLKLVEWILEQRNASTVV